MPSERGFHSRAIKDNEVDQHFRVMCESFELDQVLARPIYDNDPFYDLSHKRALFDGNKIVSVLTIIPSCYRMPSGAQVAVAAIAGVGTPPALRGRGYASRLITETLRAAPSEYGCPLAALVTDRPDYYKRFGFETCSTVIEWSASPADLPPLARSSPVTLLNAAEYATASLSIHRFLEVAMANVAGSFVRDSRRWTAFEMMSPSRKVAVLQSPSHIEGYVSYEECGEPDSLTLTIYEIVSQTTETDKALLEFIAAQPGVKTITGRTNRAQLARLGLDGVDCVQTAESVGVMMRVLEIEDVLALIGQTGAFMEPLRGTDGLTIRANNAAVTSQNRPMRLFPVSDGVSREHVALSPADEMEGQWIAGDIGSLTQMLTGYETASCLGEAGRLSSSSLEAVAIADALFLKCDPFLSVPDTF